MVIGDDAAGFEVVDFLIERGRLVPDFWFRAESNHAGHSVWSNDDTCGEQVATAVRVALEGEEANGQMPEWASTAIHPPDVVLMDGHTRGECPTVEPYYSTDLLSTALMKCLDTTDLTRDAEYKRSREFRRISIKAWRQIMPYFSSGITQKITEVEAWGNSSRARDDIDYTLERAIIRDEPFYEFYMEQGESGLKELFQGLGRRAVLGVGAMLFMSGEHDELMPVVEELENLLRPRHL